MQETDFPYEDGNGSEYEIPDIDEIPNLDRMVGAELVFPQDGATMQAGKVIIVEY